MRLLTLPFSMPWQSSKPKVTGCSSLNRCRPESSIKNMDAGLSLPSMDARQRIDALMASQMPIDDFV